RKSVNSHAGCLKMLDTRRGANAFSYVVRVGDYLFQSPISYYSKKKVWDVAPGYESDDNPDFTRPITVECLLCHSGRPLPVEGTLNRYQDPPFAAEGISCERCHGPVEEHLKRPSAATIINPKRLAPRARDSICEQCHLTGEARIPNPGRHISDFQPGQELEDVFSVFVYQSPVEGAIKVVSHAEQLALSRCALASAGRLSCGTCHNPHEASPPSYRAKCLECHAGRLAPAHQAASRDCISCHMQRQPTRDGGHTAFTDHRISRVPMTRKTSTDAGLKLVPWQPPPASLATRNLGLANIVAGDREHNALLMDTGFRLLSGNDDLWKDDHAVLTALGLVILRKGRPADAARFYDRAIALAPAYAEYHINFATALRAAGDTHKAIEQLEKAIEMDPSLEPAYRVLADIYAKDKQGQKARETLRRYLKFNPNNVTVQNLLVER
ncbi:MAG: tetratricopeptide repeat protein, partial [Bryobacteraceae bacterium]